MVFRADGPGACRGPRHAQYQVARAAVAVVALVLTGLLAGCSGGGGGSNAATAALPAARSLPPDPGTAAAATVVGVDANANGVRDEVERALAATLADDATYGATLSAARAYQRLLTDAPPADRAAALAMFGRVACASGSEQVSNGADGDLLVRLTFDTADRQVAYARVADMTESGFEASELPPCTP